MLPIDKSFRSMKNRHRSHRTIRRVRSGQENFAQQTQHVLGGTWIDIQPNTTLYCVRNFLRDSDHFLEILQDHVNRKFPGWPRSISNISLIEFEAIERQCPGAKAGTQFHWPHNWSRFVLHAGVFRIDHHAAGQQTVLDIAHVHEFHWWPSFHFKCSHTASTRTFTSGRDGRGRLHRDDGVPLEVFKGTTNPVKTQWWSSVRPREGSPRRGSARRRARTARRSWRRAPRNVVIFRDWWSRWERLTQTRPALLPCAGALRVWVPGPHGLFASKNFLFLSSFWTTLD